MAISKVTAGGIADIAAALEAASDSNKFTDADHSKLNAIEASATADQTAAQIKAAVEAASDSNTFTDADHSKLNAIEASATADQTDAQIRTAVEAASDSNVFTDADHSKLNAVEANATADQTAAQIKTALENGIDSVHYVDGSIDGAHIANDAIDSQHYAAGSINYTAYLGADVVTTSKILNDAVTADKLANSINTDIATGPAALPKAGGAMTGNVTHADNVKAQFGTGNDLEIYHDGSNSYIADVGTGDLTIRASNDLRLQSAATEAYLTCNENDGVEIYHNNVKKLETTSAGATVTGVLTATLQANAIDSDHYVDGSIDAAHINDGAVTATKIGNDAINHADKIADGVIASEHYQDGSIDTEHLSADCVTAAKIGDDVINSEHIADGAIDLAHMSSGSVDEDNLRVSNNPTNGFFLQAQSGNTGGLTWTQAAGTLVKSTIAYSNNTRQVFSMSAGVSISSENFKTPSSGYHYFTCSKTSSSSTLVFHLSLCVDGGQQQHVFGLWRTSGSSSANSGVTNFTRLSYDHDRAIGSSTGKSMVLGGIVTMASLGTGQHHFWFSFGRSNDSANVKYTLNPDTNDAGDKSGASTSTIVINEIEI